jgi:hypothetical protein
VADKFTQQLTDALAKAAAHPTGLPLYAGKTDPGLFPNTTSARPAAQRCLADKLLRAVGTDPKGKAPRELYALTDAGWEFLLAQVNPKQVLEDFIRVLEARRGEVGELLDTARRMAESLQGLKDAVSRVLPVVSATRLPAPVSHESKTSAPPSALVFDSRLTGETEPAPTAAAVLEAEPEADFAPALLARLADWSGTAGEDCPLPELFRSLSLLERPPTIGEFHDCLRRLHADGAVYLHPWTGPLYAIPEPAYALLAGHGIAYYASLREAGVRRQEAGVREDPAPLRLVRTDS